jgi:hypothetical protein
MGNERAGCHLLTIGEVSAAEPHFRKACSSYEKWGGKAKRIVKSTGVVDFRRGPLTTAKIHPKFMSQRIQAADDICKRSF